MASSSSFSNNFLTQEETEELRLLSNYLDSTEFDFDEGDFKEVESEMDVNYAGEVEALANKFHVNLTKKGKDNLNKLVGHYRHNNDAEYIVMQFTKLSPDIPQMFVGMGRMKAASALRKIIEDIVSPAVDIPENSPPISCNDYDRQVIIYMAGHILYKAMKKNERWEHVTPVCSTLPGYEITQPVRA